MAGGAGLDQYSIAEARDHFTQIVHMAERGRSVRLLRHGKTVAIVLSIQEYERLASPGDFWTTLAKFREQIETGEREAVEPDAFAGLRDTAPGRSLSF